MEKKNNSGNSLSSQEWLSQAEWFLLKTLESPPKSYGGTLNFYEGKVYLYGGYTDKTYLDSLFVFDVAQGLWTDVKCKGQRPGSRYSHCSLRIGSSLYIHGGKSISYHSDLYKFNLVSAKWKNIRARGKFVPPARYGHSAVCFERGIYIFGGYDHHGFTCHELFHFNTKSLKWTKVPANICPNLARHLHSAVLYSRSMFVFGGKAIHNISPPNLLQFHFETGKWKEVVTSGEGPSSRWGHTASVATFENQDVMFIYGGCNSETVFTELYAYFFASRTWRLIDVGQCPSPRCFHTACTDPSTNTLYIVGGKNLVDYCFNDIHCFRDKPPDNWLSFHSSNSLIIPDPTQHDGDLRTSMGNLTTHKVRLKCEMKGENRMISVDKDIEFSCLMARLQDEYQLPVVLQYNDEENDLITVRSDHNLREAIGYHLQQNTNSFKVYLTADGVGKSKKCEVKTSGRYQKGIKPNNRIVHWKKGGRIGQGGFGVVYEAMNTDTGELMAVKQLLIPNLLIQSTTNSKANYQSISTSDTTIPSFSPTFNPHSVEAIQREIEIMKGLSHQNIVRYLGSERRGNTLSIFLELVPGGTVATLLKKYDCFPEKVVSSFGRQILLGLNYLHKKGFAHRDIKGANILVTNDGTPKLCDFGCSKELKDIVSYGKGCDTVTGTPYWMAPEVIVGNNYGRKADIWSFGAVVIEMATGSPPWSEFEPVPALFQIGKEGSLPTIPNFLSQMAVHFINLCFTRIPSKRPTAEQLLGHEFLNIASTPQLKESAKFIFKAELERETQSKTKKQWGFQQTMVRQNGGKKETNQQIDSTYSTMTSFPSLSSLEGEYSFDIQNAEFTSLSAHSSLQTISDSDGIPYGEHGDSAIADLLLNSH